ncbi:MAG: phospholipase D-like domain-containing protein [Acidiferrobacter sp.]
MLAIQPQAGTRPFVRLITQAHGYLDINMYLFADRPLIQAVRAAVARGVRVRIVLDRRPYGGRPRGEVQTLRATGAQVRFAPPRFTGRYRFDHAKYLVTSTRVAIGSANFTWSAFHRNNEYDWISNQPVVARALQAVFRADLAGRRAGSLPRRAVVLSPGATQALLAAIDQPGPAPSFSFRLP